MKMTHFDLTPLYRSTIGFDRLASLFDTLNSPQSSPTKNQSYPPYNVERLDETNYRISMAVAGFGEDEIDIEQKGTTLTIRGTTAPEAKASDTDTYLYRGIAARNFERGFQLADNVKVVHAELDKGLLHIALEREIPEAERARKINIANSLKAA
jgi:molecular chaperone IbpA